MRKIFGTLIACLFLFNANAQFTVSGSVTAKTSGSPVEAATVTLVRDNAAVASVTSKIDGTFTVGNIKQKGNYTLSVEHIGLRKKSIPVSIPTAENVVFVLEDQSHYLEPLEVKSIRAADKAPFTKTNISKQEITKNNMGQDLPFLLNQTPSVVINSDAGNGFGYTGIRIRGSDATRINVTMNGIPYNDAESQGTFFVDMPDIASSLNSIQVQRGVGTSSNGAGAFGATINLSTNEFNDKPYGELINSVGSFNSWKHTVKAGTGLLNDHFTVDARLSKLSSDGYVDRASTDLQSLQLSTAYYNKNSSLRLNIITGKEKTYQAWNGVPENLLAIHRTFNSAGTEKPGEPYDNETDNYVQDHYQLFFNHAFNGRLSFNTALFLTKGKGYYEQYKAGEAFSDYGLPDVIQGSTTITETDLVRRRWLDNDFYGQIFSLQFKTKKDELNIGGGWNRYEGKHFGDIIWAETGVPKNHQWYNVLGTKTDVNVFTKWQHSLNNKWQIFTDVQYRHVNYKNNGFRDNPAVKVHRQFNFINPKAGITYTYNGWQAYLSYAMANKEPNRDDFEAGIINQPKREQLHDVELSIEKRTSRFTYGATGYYMYYKDQLILTGQINDVGAYTRVNVPNSYRIGVEMQAAARLNNWINIAANLSLSDNKIKASEEFVDEYDGSGDYVGQVKILHEKTPISFSPSVIGGATVNITPFKGGEISLLSKYVSRQFLDNTGNKARSLNAYFVQDARVTYSLKNILFEDITFIGQVNNLLNTLYEPNGYTYSYIYDKALTTENYYFPMAGINFMVGLNIRL